MKLKLEKNTEECSVMNVSILRKNLFICFWEQSSGCVPVMAIIFYVLIMTTLEFFKYCI